jgi:hypothetical protein
MIYDVLILVILYVMNYIMVLIWKLPNISTIQKPYYRSFPVPMASFVDALRPEKYFGAHVLQEVVCQGHRLAYCHGSFPGQRWLT